MRLSGTAAAAAPLQVLALGLAWSLAVWAIFAPPESPWLVAGASLLALALTVSLWIDVRRKREEIALRRALSEKLTHELRTALAHVQSYNEMILLGRERSSEERQLWLEVVGREALRIGSAVEDLLLLLEDENATTFPARRRLDLTNLVEDIAAAYPLTPGEGAAIDVEGGAGIPIDADPQALRHALENVFACVTRSAPAGSRARVTIGSERTSAGSHARIDLVAPGPTGSDAEALRWQRDERRTGSRATRLPLEVAVAERIIRAHGGRAGTITGGVYRVELPTAEDRG